MHVEISVFEQGKKSIRAAHLRLYNIHAYSALAFEVFKKLL